MELKNSFTVPAPVDDTWDFLNDVPRVIPCMPGAELLETLGDDEWKARVSVKIGPIALKFDSEVTRTVCDAEAGQVVLAVKAREIRGRGAATATITSALASEGDGTSVLIDTDLVLQGPVAQYGRSMVADIAAQMTAQFADSLSHELTPASSAQAPTAGGAADVAPAPRPQAPAPAKPVNGLRLVLGAMARSFFGLFKRGRRQ